MEEDWSRVLTQAFRKPAMQERMNLLFRNQTTTTINREEFEYMIVRTCADLIKIINKRNLK